MMNDASRNEAYQLAIRRAIGNRTNLQVLDLGCGAGLLSMMAARAGAERVTAVEATPILAEMARAVVKRNGYEKQITVHGKRSLDLEVPRDMPEKADLVISEVVNTALIGEGMLKTYNDALERLVKPSAVMIPQAGAVEALLVESPEIERHTRIDAAAGFDLRDFNLFHPADYMQASAHSRGNSTQANPLNSVLPPPQYALRHTDYRPLTDKFRPLVFDFRSAHKVHHPAPSMRRRAWCGVIWFNFSVCRDRPRRGSLRSGSNGVGGSSRWRTGLSSSLTRRSRFRSLRSSVAGPRRTGGKLCNTWGASQRSRLEMS